MSPDACIGLLHMLDRWALTLRSLAGQPAPPLPNLPGRRIVAHDEPLPDEELRAITSATELGLVLGISRQAAHQRLAKRALADDCEGGTHD